MNDVKKGGQDTLGFQQTGEVSCSVSTAIEPVLSVVVVTWNGKRYALECLQSLDLPCAVPMEIVVIDNNSTDGTPSAIEQQYPQVRLIQNKANVGFARANNIGLAVGRGKYLCLVNSDVVLPVGCLERMVAYMEAHPDVGVLGPRMITPDGCVGASVMRFPTLWNSFCSALGLHTVFPKSLWLGGFEMSGYSYESIDDVEVLTGWLWVVSRKALEEVGGLDERFFMYGEDVDWCYRFRRAGWRAVFFPGAEALHYGGASSAAEPIRFYIEMLRANSQYFRKHHGWTGGLGYYIVACIHQITRMMVYSVLRVLRPYRAFEAGFKMRRSASCLLWLISGRRRDADPGH